MQKKLKMPLSLFPGKVVALYSRFDVIVSVNPYHSWLEAGMIACVLNAWLTG